jgi:hypothetical protein
MRVSVKAGDARLAQTLQEHIPDLTNRLDQQRFRAEVWTPRTESAAKSQESSNNNNGQNSQKGSESWNQNGSGRQQNPNGRQQNQPDWLDELDGIPSSNSTLRSTQTWPQ